MIPKELEWCNILIDMAFENQKRLCIQQPFCYLTVRHGIVDSTTDDEWHVDGFSMNKVHIPEQNYLWASDIPTEVISKAFLFPEDFDPIKHNIQYFFQDNIDPEIDNIHQLKAKTLYATDPYIVHRRPLNTA
jgi:hypothetical protein